MIYIDIILPIPTLNTFTYCIPEAYENDVRIGKRVVVQFGAKKFYTGIIFSIHSGPTSGQVKGILTILDKLPIIDPIHLKLWKWIADYYMCSLGEIYKAAIPSLFRIESETYLYKNSKIDIKELNPSEKAIVEIMCGSKGVPIKDIVKKLALPDTMRQIHRLIEREVITILEIIPRDYKSKTEKAVRFTGNSKHIISEKLNELNRSKKQKYILEIFSQLTQSRNIVTKRDLIAASNVTNETYRKLLTKGVIEEYDIESDTKLAEEVRQKDLKILSVAQSVAINSLRQLFVLKDVVVLMGVTSSGKTELYIHLIKEYLDRQENVLYLLPEIALTTQITSRLKQVFGDKLILYHSRLNDSERAEIWRNLINTTDNYIVLGVRSSIFLPFTKLGLIIVDEEHESSYKQQDTNPRYNARDTAIVLARLFNSKVLLGSATPSVESYNNALTGKFGLVELKERYKNIKLPAIEIVDTKELRRKKIMKSILSPPLIDKINSAITQNEQAILFQNRRGFAPIIECKVCSWTPQCQHCDVSLTYHKKQNILICHYCGATYSVPTICPECKTETMDTVGYGTERIEEEVSQILPQAKIVRMDMDTTRTKRAFNNIISNFENGKTNILIGTQMVTKGLDFENVSVVGIINADNLLNFPDFRAHERAFQLMTQVSGRAGRKNRQGLVVVQTSQPTHPIIKYVQENDYLGFFNNQLIERKLFKYPPFYRFIEIILRGKNDSILDAASKEIADDLKKILGDRVLGPTRPVISRIQSLHIRKILVKIERNASVKKVQRVLLKQKDILLKYPDYRSILIHFNVDPL